MCTALYNDHYFGRNLDLEKSFGEKVVITPRNYPFHFRNGEVLNNHYAMIGMAIIIKDYPLYFDAANEYGLAIAGLNYPEANYKPLNEDLKNIASFELIPYLLGNYKNIQEVKEALNKINISNLNFSEDFKASPLHWLIADQKEAIVLESDQDGLKIYENPLGILTNSPSFDKQLFNLNNYQRLSKKAPLNTFSNELELKTYSYGMGAMGLPGDLSSMSRFVRLAFYKKNSFSEGSEESERNHFFKLLESVYQIKGANEIRYNEFEYTVYTSCIDLFKAIYYYKTYEDPKVREIHLKDYNLDLNILFQE